MKRKKDRLVELAEIAASQLGIELYPEKELAIWNPTCHRRCSAF